MRARMVRAFPEFREVGTDRPLVVQCLARAKGHEKTLFGYEGGPPESKSRFYTYAMRPNSRLTEIMVYDDGIFYQGGFKCKENKISVLGIRHVLLTILS